MAASSTSKENDEKSVPSPSRSSSPATSPPSGDVSDRRDADIMTQKSSLKSEEYRLLFRLPPDEVLLQYFNCAIQESILLQGHMYLFTNHICFYSNIFGFETKKTIPFHGVTCVRKAKTAVLFPNAIEIITGDKKYFFGSFLSRAEAYDLIVNGWAKHHTESSILLEHQESTSENGQDNATAFVEGGTTQSSDASLPTHRNICNNSSEEHRPLLKDKHDAEGSEMFSEDMENRKDDNGEPPSYKAPLAWKIEDADAPEMPERFALVVEAKFPVSIEDFFTLFISDSASVFMQRFHQTCGDKDFQCTPWCQHEQVGYTRDLSFLHPVKFFFGSKLGRCQEFHKYRVYRNSHLVIEMSQHVSEMPYSDYFHVERIWDVNGNEEDGCILRVYFDMVFSKKTMFKGKIEKATRDELLDAHRTWIINALELLKQRTVEKAQGISGQQRGLNQNQEEGAGSSSKLEGTTEKLFQTVTPSMALEDSVSEMDSPIRESPRYPMSVVSFVGELWTNLISYAKSRVQFPTYLVMAVIAILILIQISIIILLRRVPEVHVVNQGSLISSPDGLKTEWLAKRIDYLKEEMLMVQTQLERMHREHGMLKTHLESLEKLKSKL